MDKPTKPDLDKAQKQVKSYLHYSGIGFQMAATIGLGAFAGWWIDKQLHWGFPLFTLVLSLGGVAAAIYFLIKETGRKDR
ncbi:MAG TPA: AtpZ/AtpI family protein [Flavobacteriales bacterium]|jgi:F0F1-type ATP synthase assembly protein I|nr:AtpZ/AtpI family protein [Flavobacteriales bacterium]